MGYLLSAFDIFHHWNANNAMKGITLGCLAIGPDRNQPVNELSEGYFRQAFPTLFLSGDGDPYQSHNTGIIIVIYGRKII